MCGVCMWAATVRLSSALFTSHDCVRQLERVCAHVGEIETGLFRQDGLFVIALSITRSVSIHLSLSRLIPHAPALSLSLSVSVHLIFSFNRSPLVSCPTSTLSLFPFPQTQNTSMLSQLNLKICFYFHFGPTATLKAQLALEFWLMVSVDASPGALYLTKLVETTTKKKKA